MIRKRNDADGYKKGVLGFASDEKAFLKPESTIWNPTPTEIPERDWTDDLNAKGGDKWAKDRNETGLRNKLPDEAVNEICDVWDGVKDVGDYETDTAFTGELPPEAKSRELPNSYQGNQRKGSKW